MKYEQIKQENENLAAYIDYTVGDVGIVMGSGYKEDMKALMVKMASVFSERGALPKISREDLEQEIEDTKVARWNTKFDMDVYMQLSRFARGGITANPELEKYVFGMYNMVNREAGK